jgi:hypothetical protein
MRKKEGELSVRLQVNKIEIIEYSSIIRKVLSSGIAKGQKD